MRIALTKGTLWVPPTYFALTHALAMEDLDWRVFTLVSEVSDPRLAARLDRIDVVPGRIGAIPLGRRPRELLKWGALARMVGLVEGWAPALVHQQMATWSLPAVRASRRLGVPLVTTLHGGDATGGGSGWGARWNARNREAAFAHSDVLLAVSHYLADVALEAGAPGARLEVHYQGVDTDWFTPGPDRDRGDARAGSGPLRRLLFVGALSELKGIRDLLAVSESLRASLPHELHVVGAGPLEAEVRDHASRLPHVTVLGALDRHGVRDEMRRADALVLPTQRVDGRAEAAGLVLLEAQACATPVVANAVGGTPEMLRDGETGWLTVGGDRDSLAGALRRVLSVPGAELADMGTRARQWVLDERSVSGATAQLRDVYEHLLWR